jgi:hypothetical protein
MFKYKVMLELNLDDDKYPDWIIETLSTQLQDEEDILNYSITREDNQNDN